MRGYTNDKNTGLNNDILSDNWFDTFQTEEEEEEEKKESLCWHLEDAYSMVSYDRVVKEVTNHKYATIPRLEAIIEDYRRAIKRTNGCEFDDARARHHYGSSISAAKKAIENLSKGIARGKTSYKVPAPGTF